MAIRPATTLIGRLMTKASECQLVSSGCVVAYSCPR
jgi:hypothetical protein